MFDNQRAGKALESKPCFGGLYGKRADHKRVLPTLLAMLSLRVSQGKTVDTSAQTEEKDRSCSVRIELGSETRLLSGTTCTPTFARPQVFGFPPHPPQNKLLSDFAASRTGEIMELVWTYSTLKLSVGQSTERPSGRRRSLAT